jgi:putative thioredoxin
MGGAIDLAAVKARSEAAARAAEAPAPTADAAVVAVTEASFQAEVMDRSFQVPVLLNLWSERSEASKQLALVLERLAREAGGGWILGNIEVDANMAIAQALKVQSIPTVFAVIGGQLVPGFQGALPEPQLREFLNAVLQAAQEAGLSGAVAAPASAQDEVEPPGDPRFSAAEEALELGDYALAAQRYEEILAVEPGNTDADLALRQVRLLERIEGLDPELVERAATDPDDVSAQLAAADYALAGNDVDAAFERLLGLVRRVSGDDRNAVRDRLVEYFELIGSDDPRVPPARRALTNALF